MWLNILAIIRSVYEQSTHGLLGSRFKYCDSDIWIFMRGFFLMNFMSLLERVFDIGIQNFHVWALSKSSIVHHEAHFYGVFVEVWSVLTSLFWQICCWCDPAWANPSLREDAVASLPWKRLPQAGRDRQTPRGSCHCEYDWYLHCHAYVHWERTWPRTILQVTPSVARFIAILSHCRLVTRFFTMIAHHHPTLTISNMKHYTQPLPVLMWSDASEWFIISYKQFI